MAKEFNHNYWSGFTAAILIVMTVTSFGFIIYLFYDVPTNLIGSDTSQGIDSIVYKCSNRTIIESAYCVRDITGTFFKLNISNIEKDIDFETLKNEGGMCESWTSYWCKIGDKLGYNTKRVEIDVDYINLTYQNNYDTYDVKHTFCIWSDIDAYVKLDFMDVSVTEFAKGYLDEGSVIE